MKARELIGLLKLLPPDTEIVLPKGESRSCVVESVKAITPLYDSTDLGSVVSVKLMARPEKDAIGYY